MQLYPLFTNILTYTLSGVGIVWVAFYFVKPYLDRHAGAAALDYKKNLNSQTLPLKLQAYERLVLFIERINPANMLVRLNAPVYTAAELHGLILTEIRNEFQHNVTQQIYVSNRSWSVLQRVKEDTIAVVTGSISKLPQNSSGLDLSKAILGGLSQMENNPYEIGIELIKKDLEGLF